MNLRANVHALVCTNAGSSHFSLQGLKSIHCVNRNPALSQPGFNPDSTWVIMYLLNTGIPGNSVGKSPNLPIEVENLMICGQKWEIW